MLRPHISIEEKGENVYKKLRTELKQLDGAFVKVGFPEGGKVGSPGKRKKDAKPYSDMSEIAQIAAWNEFGVPGKNKEWQIPPRPFFRSAVDGGREALKGFKEKVYNLFVLGRLSPAQALDELGLWMQARLRTSIRNGDWPANAPSTIKAKGSSKPLIDTAQMLNSVTWIKILAGKK
jgi:hypothetical protein